MDRVMAEIANGDQVVVRIIALMSAEDDVMSVKVAAAGTDPTAPAVTFIHLLAEIFIIVPW